MEQRLQSYLSKTIELAKTLTFKSELVAQAMNRGLVQLGYPVEETQPETWKYYLNLAGQYHSTNTRMSVVSLDTLETIEFTTQNLDWHRSTRDAYRYGTRFYHDLVSQYPGQETLINAIVSPVDIDEALASEDGTILAWDDTLVDPNETNLIPDLQDWIQQYLHRWNVPAYQMADELYAASLLGVLYTQLPLTILTLRQKNVNTARAHGFHIREYLAGYQRLDEFYELLTLDQRLFLYRNLDYLATNAGNRDTFDMLVENLLTRRGISLLSYDLRQNHDKVPDIDLYPEIDFLGDNLNFKARNVYGFPEAPTDMVGKLNAVATGNPDVVTQEIETVERLGKDALLTQVPTKTLEARAVDASALYEVSLEETLLNHWLYLASTGVYSATVPVTNPVTGLAQSLTAGEAWVVYYYCWARSQNVDLPTIPTFLATQVQRPDIPTLERMAIWYGGSDNRLSVLRDRLSPYTLLQQPSGFHERVQSIHSAYLLNTWLYKNEENHWQHGRLRLIHQRCYQDVEVDLYTGENYEAWLLDRGVVVGDFNTYDYEIFADEILRRFTHLDASESDGIRRTLNAMVSIMGRLSSYHVHYIPYVENDNYFVLDWVTDRLTDTGTQGYRELYPTLNTRVEDVGGYGHQSLTEPTHTPLRSVRTQSRTVHEIDTRVVALAPSHVQADRWLPQSPIHLSTVEIVAR